MSEEDKAPESGDDDKTEKRDDMIAWVDPAFRDQDAPLPDEPAQSAEESEAEEKAADDGAEKKEPDPEAGKDDDEGADKEAAGKADEDKSDDDKKERKRGKRGGRQVRERRERQRLAQENERLTQELEELRKSQEQAAAEAPQPRLQDFDTIEEWSTAMADWTASQVKAVRDESKREREQAAEADRQRANDEASQKKMQAWQDAEDVVAEKYDDYDEVMESLFLPDDNKAAVAVATAIFESEQGPEIAYRLGKDRAENERIIALTPLAAVREIGRMEARLAAEAPASTEPVPNKGATRKTTSAPDPAKTVRGGATPSKDYANMSDAEYRAARGYPA